MIAHLMILITSATLQANSNYCYTYCTDIFRSTLVPVPAEKGSQNLKSIEPAPKICQNYCEKNNKDFIKCLRAINSNDEEAQQDRLLCLNDALGNPRMRSPRKTVAIMRGTFTDCFLPNHDMGEPVTDRPHLHSAGDDNLIADKFDILSGNDCKKYFADSKTEFLFYPSPGEAVEAYNSRETEPQPGRIKAECSIRIDNKMLTTVYKNAICVFHTWYRVAAFLIEEDNTVAKLKKPTQWELLGIKGRELLDHAISIKEIPAANTVYYPTKVEARDITEGSH
jgi:hypothetical protein